MRLTYSVLAGLLFVASTALGLFFLGTAGLAASTPAMSIVGTGWGVGCLAALVGLVFAVRRLSLPALFALCLVPFALALLASNLALRLGQ